MSSKKTNYDSIPPETGVSSLPPIDREKDRYPCCIVWTPIPIITWIFPIIGHMGIALSNGVIRDFDGPYHVSEDNMGFGRPVKYWQLDLKEVKGGAAAWDQAVTEASEIYKKRMHILWWDNCHSHVGKALALMNYKNSSSWNMVKLCLLMLLHGKYVDFKGVLKTWLPFFVIIVLIMFFIAVSV